MERLTKRDVNSVAYIEHGYCEAAANMQAIQRLAAYEDAEEQGWDIAACPVKLHQHIYRIFNGTIQDEIVENAIFEMNFKRWKVFTMGGAKYYWKDVFNKTVFLTREAAEAALSANNDSTGGYTAP